MDGQREHREAVTLLQRIVRALGAAMDNQTLLYEHYLDALGTSGSETRAALDSRSQEERELESMFNAPAIRARRRQPPRPTLW